MIRSALAAVLLLAAMAAGQTDDSNIPVLKRRPAPSDSSKGTGTTLPPSSPAESPQPVSPIRAAPSAITPTPADVQHLPAPARAADNRDVLITRSGGVLRVTVADPNDADGAGRINLGLRDAAARYKRGDFERAGSPAPGTSVLRQMRSRIIYTAHAIDGGAELIISSQDQKAVEAIHQFLESQKDQQ